MRVHCVAQCKHFKQEEYIDKVLEIIADKRWSIQSDFDGCTLVQDRMHPYIPCLIHDYNWVIDKPRHGYDIQFREDLVKFGMPRWKAFIMYLGVSLGRIFYYRWK